MREKPFLQDERLIDLLRTSYGLRIERVEFLPIGADINAAKYRVETDEPALYFLKLRKGFFEEASLLIPQFLHDQGIRQVIPPLKTKAGQAWTNLEGYTCILYPYVEGHNGFEASLSDDEWIEFGSVLKRIHSVSLPPGLQGLVPSETWSPRWRELVKGFQAQAESDSYADPLAAQMAAFLRMHREEIRCMTARAEQLAQALRSRPPSRLAQWVLCHADLHAWNLLHGPREGLYIIDWDNPILAPKERDLMFIGAGVGGIWNTPREAALFYQGYGGTEIDLTVLTYYRYERILEDVAEFSEQILSTTGETVDRQRGLQQFSAAFLPNDVVEIAFQTDRRLKEAG